MLADSNTSHVCPRIEPIVAQSRACRGPFVLIPHRSTRRSTLYHVFPLATGRPVLHFSHLALMEVTFTAMLIFGGVVAKDPVARRMRPPNKRLCAPHLAWAQHGWILYILAWPRSPVILGASRLSTGLLLAYLAGSGSQTNTGSKHFGG